MWRTFVFGLAGLVVGLVIGFLLGFSAIMVQPRAPYGEMQGVAALSLGFGLGAPVGGLGFCALGIWLGMRQDRRRRSEIAAPDAQPTLHQQSHTEQGVGSERSDAIRKDRPTP